MTITLCQTSSNTPYILNGILLKSTTQQKDLGVTFDGKLCFREHTAKATKKAMSLLGILYRFTDIKDINALRTYFANGSDACCGILFT